MYGALYTKKNGKKEHGGSGKKPKKRYCENVVFRIVLLKLQSYWARGQKNLAHFLVGGNAEQAGVKGAKECGRVNHCERTGGTALQGSPCFARNSETAIPALP